MTVTYRIDSLKQRQPSETDPLLEALCNSPEFIRDDIQDNIDEVKMIKQIVIDNHDHIDLLHGENAAHLSEIRRKAAELTLLYRKLASANEKAQGGSDV